MVRSVRIYGVPKIRLTCSLQVTIRVVLLFLALVLSSMRTIGQEVHIIPHTNAIPIGAKASDSPAPADGTTFQARVDLVLVPVAVTDPLGRLVTGLDKDNFEIYEGKEKQAIRTFSSEDTPVSLGIILDSSGSMASKIERARDAVKELIGTANPQDEFFLITFADAPELVTDFTTSVEGIQNQLLYARPRGSTALLDAIYLGITNMRHAKYAKKALLIISDGGDNHSRYHEHEVKSLVREADTLVYAIGIYDVYFSTLEEQIGPALLSDISDVSGGRMFTVENPNDLPSVAMKIGAELRNEYVMGYRPMNPKYDGKWHKIKVRLSLPKGLPRCEAHAKQGYYALSQ